MSTAEAPTAPHHRGVTRTDAAATSARASPLRIGIINIMPRAETYERYLLAPLDEAGLRVEPIWIRLRSHVYSSSEVGHIARRYETYEDSFGVHGLDGLILTGAPVEELSFDDITYWPELCEILCHARAYVPT